MLKITQLGTNLMSSVVKYFLSDCRRKPFGQYIPDNLPLYKSKFKIAEVKAKLSSYMQEKTYKAHSTHDILPFFVNSRTALQQPIYTSKGVLCLPNINSFK